jgi:hypothetical protein
MLALASSDEEAAGRWTMREGSFAFQGALYPIELHLGRAVTLQVAMMVLDALTLPLPDDLEACPIVHRRIAPFRRRPFRLHHDSKKSWMLVGRRGLAMVLVALGTEGNLCLRMCL